MGRLALTRKYGQVTVLTFGPYHAKIVVLESLSADSVILSIEADMEIDILREEAWNRQRRKRIVNSEKER